MLVKFSPQITKQVRSRDEAQEVIAFHNESDHATIKDSVNGVYLRFGGNRFKTAGHRVPNRRMEAIGISMNGEQQVRLVEHPYAAPMVYNRHLRDVRHPHTLRGSQQRVVRGNSDHCSRFIATRDQLAKGAVSSALEITLVQKPELVIHLGKVF